MLTLLKNPSDNHGAQAEDRPITQKSSKNSLHNDASAFSSLHPIKKNPVRPLAKPIQNSVHSQDLPEDESHTFPVSESESTSSREKMLKHAGWRKTAKKVKIARLKTKKKSDRWKGIEPVMLRPEEDSLDSFWDSAESDESSE